jgi:hypothetical protein
MRYPDTNWYVIMSADKRVVYVGDEKTAWKLYEKAHTLTVVGPKEQNA